MPKFEVPENSSFLTAGIHKMEVVNAVEKVSQKGNEMIEVTLESANGGRIKDFLVFVPKAAFKIRQFLEAAGRNLKSGESVSLTAKDCLDLPPLLVELAPDPGKPEFLCVKRYIAAAQAASPHGDADRDDIPF